MPRLSDLPARPHRGVAGLLLAALAAGGGASALGHPTPVRAPAPAPAIATATTSTGSLNAELTATGPAAESPAAAEAMRHLTPRHMAIQTRHWMVLSDADVAWTREQSGRLERTHAEFRRVMRRLGIEPEPLRHKLVCVLFEQRDAYRAFAREADAVVAEWVAGYYSPAADRTVFYRADANHSVVAARARLAELEGDLAAIESRLLDARRRGDVEHARRLEAQRNAWHEHLGGEARRINAFTDEVGVATVVHEATHQLLFHTGVQSPVAPPPIWISEGLATSFETDDTTAAFGPDHEHPVRRERFNELLADGRTLIQLRQLVAWDRVPADDPAVIDALYHQSYALTTWLFRTRRPQLRSFMLEIRDAPPRTEADRVAAFERAFGPVERLEMLWLRWERRSG